jgi:tRNA U34 5-methylaminomethyl-2-thiouridine-forming methyltransferase MnmC
LRFRRRRRKRGAHLRRFVVQESPASPRAPEVVETSDGSLTLRHPGHGECYHSHVGAAAEARELYVIASGIESAWASPVPVTVLDVGLGLGYNALATIRSWMAAPAPPDPEVASLEIDPELASQVASARAPWQATWDQSSLGACAALKKEASGIWRAEIPHPSSPARCLWTVHVGDASILPVPTPRQPAAGWRFVWQDPFSPEKNPPLWGPAWFARVGETAAPDAVLMTYSVARAVREALTAAGWGWEKIATPWPTKRHWLKARRPPLI